MHTTDDQEQELAKAIETEIVTGQKAVEEERQILATIQAETGDILKTYNEAQAETDVEIAHITDEMDKKLVRFIKDTEVEE